MLRRRPGACCMLKYVVIFLIISLIAGALGMSGISQLARRVSLVLLALFFAIFLALVGFAYLVAGAIDHAVLVTPVWAGVA
jgi:uncharacterized membrane protein YtjA (UPF0391 family)